MPDPVFKTVKDVVFCATPCVEEDEEEEEKEDARPEQLNAITCVQIAIWQQRQQGCYYLSTSILQDLKQPVNMANHLVAIEDPVLLFALPVEVERLTAGAVYLMKDDAEEVTVGGQVLKKIRLLDKRINSYKLVFQMNEVEYLAHFQKEQGGFIFTLCKKSDD